jgi:MerR family transcriptional regulator, light-induced transcriptional regulator
MHLLKLGFESTVTSVVYPFLEKIGVLWLVGTINPAQEHFIVNLIRQKLIAAIDGLMVTPSIHALKFVLFLPPNELHELSLLHYWYILKKMGHKVLYFGQSLPVEDLKTVAHLQSPDYMLTVITAAQTHDQYKTLINSFSSTLPGTKVFITGLQTRENIIGLPENIIQIENAEELFEIIAEKENQPEFILFNPTSMIFLILCDTTATKCRKCVSTIIFNAALKPLGHSHICNLHIFTVQYARFLFKPYRIVLNYFIMHIISF